MTTATKSRPKAKADEKSQPLFKARLEALQLAIWGNEYVTDAGEMRIYHNASIERNYLDRNDEWKKTTIQLRYGDFGDAVALLLQAQQFMTKVEYRPYSGRHRCGAGSFCSVTVIKDEDESIIRHDLLDYCTPDTLAMDNVHRA